MATINQLGLVDDGSNDLTVQDQISVGGFFNIAQTLLGSGSSGSAGEAGHGSFAVGSFVPVPGPGFFRVPVTGSTADIGQRGAGGFTGSLPNPASFPGGQIIITDTLGLYNWLLTGTIAVPVASTGTSGQVGGFLGFLSSSVGSKLFLTSGSTVGLWSDSKGWLVVSISGSAFLRA